jgi:uncharacterized protein
MIHRLLCLAACLAVCLAARALAPTTARAAGIDCAKAATPVEKMLCADPALRQADSAVADAFAQARDAGPDPAAVRASQRDWLKTRNACPDPACLAAVHARRQAELEALAAAGSRQSLEERAKLRTRLGWPDACEASFQDLASPQGQDRKNLGTGVESHALGDGRTLYCVQCDLAAYQATYVALLQDKPDGPGTLLRFPQYDREGAKVTRTESPDLVGLLDFDAKTGELTVSYKARGIGDCGSLVRYAFPAAGAPKVVEARVKACSDHPRERDADTSTWPLVKNP